MAILTLDGYISSVRQRIGWAKTATRTTVAGVPFSGFDLAGNPGAGVLVGTATGTATPVMPSNTDAGFNFIEFTTGVGYLSKVEFSNTVSSRLAIYDMNSKSRYAYTAGTSTITTPLDISSRCPDFTGGANYGSRNEIWIEVCTAFVTGTAWQVQVTYYNQAGVLKTSIISAAQNAAALTLGKMFQIALAAGDYGVQSIKSVIVTNGGTAMTAGAFNVLIMRPIWTSGIVVAAHYGDIHDMLKTGMPIVYNNSALYIVTTPMSTSLGYPNLNFEIASA